MFEAPRPVSVLSGSAGKQAVGLGILELDQGELPEVIVSQDEIRSKQALRDNSNRIRSGALVPA